MCAHREPAYQVEPWLCGVDKCDCDLGSCDRLTESEQATERAIILPLFHQMSEQETGAGDRAREKVEQEYTLELQAQRYLSLFREILTNERNSI